MLDHSCQAHRHALAERGDDLYETPPVAVEALLRVERIPRRVWEPACGPGTIVRVLRAAAWLQHGCPLEVLARAALRDSAGRPSTPLGCVLDLVAEIEP